MLPVLSKQNLLRITENLNNRFTFSLLNSNSWKVSVTLLNAFGAFLPETNTSYLCITHCNLHTVTFLGFLNTVIKD